MDEEHFNLEIRKFLKTVGVTAQREIEKHVRNAVAAGTLAGDERLLPGFALKSPTSVCRFPSRVRSSWPRGRKAPGSMKTGGRPQAATDVSVTFPVTWVAICM